MWFCKVVFLGNGINIFGKKKITWNKLFSNLLKKCVLPGFWLSTMSQLSIPRFHQRHRALHRITAAVAFVFGSTQEEGNGVKLHWRCHASVPERPKTTGLQLASRHQWTCYVLLIVNSFFSGKHKEVSRWLPKTRTSRIATENSWEVCKYCTVKQRKKTPYFAWLFS